MAEAKLTVGNVEILVMHDAESALPLEMTFPHVTAQDWVPFKEKYPEAFDGPDNLRAHFECYLIPSQGQTILVDTGIGTNDSNPGTIQGLLGGSVEGKLLSELASAGIAPGDIDIVIMTHLHPDHVGGGARLRVDLPAGQRIVALPSREEIARSGQRIRTGQERPLHVLERGSFDRCLG